jgi:hypothetical protein
MPDAYHAFCELWASPEYQEKSANKRKSWELTGTHMFAFTGILRVARHSVPTGCSLRVRMIISGGCLKTTDTKDQHDFWYRPLKWADTNIVIFGVSLLSGPTPIPSSEDVG